MCSTDGETVGAKILVSINSMLEDWIILNHCGIPVTELGEWSQDIPPAASSLDTGYCDNKVFGDVDLVLCFNSNEHFYSHWMLCHLLGILSLCDHPQQNPVLPLVFPSQAGWSSVCFQTKHKRWASQHWAVVTPKGNLPDSVCMWHITRNFLLGRIGQKHKRFFLYIH